MFLFVLPTLLVLPTEKFKYSLIVCITNMLVKNIQTLLASANLVYRAKDYTSATILYFKCLFVILDCIILKKDGKTPKDHTERFRILEKDFPALYTVLDKYFPIYRDTYSLAINQDKCDELKENVERIIKEQKIPVDNN